MKIKQLVNNSTLNKFGNTISKIHNPLTLKELHKGKEEYQIQE